MRVPSDPTLRLLAILLACAVIPAAAAADWLVTNDGTTIETDGPWKVKGRLVIFTDAKGTLSSLRLAAIDLRASETVTAQGGPEAPPPPPATEPETPERPPVLEITMADVGPARHPPPAAEPGQAEPEDPPRIIMYSTSWCGYCRRARELFQELGVDFVEKDIEKSVEARREHTAKARGSGVPVFDFDGTIVRGYRPDVLRRLAAQLDGKK